MEWFLSLLTNTSGVGHIVMLYAFVIAAGIALGRVKIGGKKNGIALGVTFVLFVGILMGHLHKSTGFVSDEGFAAPGNVLTFIQDFGLILFVYCIGIQVGPGFVESFKTGGLKMNLIAVGVVLLNVICCIGLFFMIFYKGGSMAGENSRNLAMMVGVLCGAVTNTPGLGAATEACGNIFGANAPSIANGYACAYPLGVVGIIMAIIAVRLLTRTSLKQEQDALEQEKAAKREERRGQFYGDSETSKRYKRRPNIYIFRPEDLDNDDIISAVEQTPTYKRTREILESIGQPVQVQDTTKATESQPQDVQGVISFV